MLVPIDDYLKKRTEIPIYLIFGEEEFLIDEALNQIISEISINQDTNYDTDFFDGDDTSLLKIIDVCERYPMVNLSKTVIVKRFDKLFTGRSNKKNDEQIKFLRYLENPLSSTQLILIASIDKIKDLSKFVKNKNLTDSGIAKLKDAKFPFDIILKKHSWVEFPKIYDNDYPLWIEKRIKLKGKIIGKQAAELLSIQVKSTLRDISSEIDKLLLFIDDRTEITDDDIHNLTGTTKEYNVFELQKSIAARDLQKCLTITLKMLEHDRQEMLIIAILNKFFLNVYKLIGLKLIAGDENVIAKEMGMQKWQLQDYLFCSRNYTPQEIEDAIFGIVETDFKLKSGFTDNLALIQNLLINILKKN